MILYFDFSTYLSTVVKKEKQFNKSIEIKNKNIKKIKVTDIIKSEVQISVCDGIKDCDIDKIAELLIKKGKEKDYPDITSK